jgi:hypothetical protein
MKREKDGKEHGDPHLVPLPTQAVSILKELHHLTGHGRLVFPGERDHDRPISENSVRTALISLGYTSELQTWHGFRATARTMLAERLDVDPLLIEAQLAHAVKDANGRAYNRTKYFEQRVKMMQRWADYLDMLRTKESGRARAVSHVKAAPSMAEIFAQGAGRHRSGRARASEAAIRKPAPDVMPAVKDQTGDESQSMAAIFGQVLRG